MNDFLSPSALRQLYESSKLDTTMFVGSDIRQLVSEIERLRGMRSVTQDWVCSLTYMQQSVLMACVRGPDGIRKEHISKSLLRWFRRCTLLSAFDGCVLDNPWTPGGGSFTGPSIDDPAGMCEKFGGWELQGMDDLVGQYLRCVDELPHHFQLHFMHAAEIIGYKHPNVRIRKWWHNTYVRLVHDAHLWPETEEQMDSRLGDSHAGWAARNEEAGRATK